MPRLPEPVAPVAEREAAAWTAVAVTLGARLSHVGVTPSFRHRDAHVCVRHPEKDGRDGRVVTAPTWQDNVRNMEFMLHWMPHYHRPWKEGRMVATATWNDNVRNMELSLHKMPHYLSHAKVKAKMCDYSFALDYSRSACRWWGTLILCLPFISKHTVNSCISRREEQSKPTVISSTASNPPRKLCFRLEIALTAGPILARNWDLFRHLSFSHIVMNASESFAAHRKLRGTSDVNAFHTVPIAVLLKSHIEENTSPHPPGGRAQESSVATLDIRLLFITWLSKFIVWNFWLMTMIYVIQLLHSFFSTLSRTMWKDIPPSPLSIQDETASNPNYMEIEKFDAVIYEICFRRMNKTFWGGDFSKSVGTWALFLRS